MLKNIRSAAGCRSGRSGWIVSRTKPPKMA